MKISSSKIFKRLVLIFLISLLFKSVWLFDNQSLGQPGNDDLSYWLHAATVVYDHDFSYVEDFKVREGVFDVDTNTPYHPPGAGYLSSPFVYLFSLLDESDPERLNPVGYFAYLGFFVASLSLLLILDRISIYRKVPLAITQLLRYKRAFVVTLSCVNM